MSILHPLIGRRLFLSSTLVGVIGMIRYATAAHAGTAQSVPGTAEALSPASAPSTNHTTAVAETSVISAAAVAQASGEMSVRPSNSMRPMKIWRTSSGGSPPFRLGPDPRTALGPAASRAASTGRTRDRTRPMLQACQNVLARAPSTRDPKRSF
jgi:hypothetical protein